MDMLKRIVKKGITKLEKDTQSFEKEYLSTSEEIVKARKEMDEWRKNRKLTRNK
ncbi:hypothetical protein [Paenibacillus sp. IHBB 3054]|uniref:hypothetical protein n=1 Tax=Paenibacillus sp. IHBB 3054 TaxID=3425689 RepID=UPI003F681BA5